jgi:hypothetical protein
VTRFTGIGLVAAEIVILLGGIATAFGVVFVGRYLLGAIDWRKLVRPLHRHDQRRRERHYTQFQSMLQDTSPGASRSSGSARSGVRKQR